MKLLLKRDIFTDKSTISRLYVDGIIECWVLEDRDRGLHQGMSLNEIKKLKIPNVTAIPRGTYEVIINLSQRFKKYLPLLLDIPGFAGVRIHPGNTPENTEGCLLPGMSKGQDKVFESRIAYDSLFQKIQGAKNKGEIITIEII